LNENETDLTYCATVVNAYASFLHI